MNYKFEKFTDPAIRRLAAPLTRSLSIPTCSLRRLAAGKVTCMTPSPATELHLMDHTGDPEIDALIEEFKLGSYDRNGEARPVADLRRRSENECCYAADTFTRFLRSRGVEAYDTVETFHPDGDYPTIGDIEVFGYEDHPAPRPRFFAHAATFVIRGERTYLVDFAAGQFGYAAWPMVQMSDGGMWQRQWGPLASPDIA